MTIEVNELLPLVQPDDLLKFGLIPEFIGRLLSWSHVAHAEP